MATPSQLVDIEKALKPWESCVVALARRSIKRSHELETFGSGFLVTLRGKVFLCTAAHVISTSQNETKIVGTLDGKAIEISGLNFLYSDESDVAVAPIGKMRASVTPPQLITSLTDPAPDLWSNQIALLGFPNTLNRTGGLKSDDLRLVKVLAEYMPNPPASLARPATKSPIFLRDPGKAHWLQEETRAVVPRLNGISGGPALQLFQDSSSGELSFIPVGVTIEHHIGKCFVVTHRNEIRRAVERIIG